ncbi:MAG: NAD(P)/FAD-dependent oxidoreductase [Clostridiales bacterium]|nr:NAD(P)/FAD-dependent oxidoreductase [Clostridiales bacterium]
MHTVVIIGGGASGIMTACISASNPSNKVILIEKNEKLGKKVYITGKGRCNVTNDVEKNDFFNNVVSNPKFLFSAINSFSPQSMIEFLQNNGLEIKIERGNRVFPVSDKASDVTKTFEKLLKKLNVDVRLNTEVLKINSDGQKIASVITSNGQVECDSVVVCTGGVSYPLTGSTGDGYEFAKQFGHTIIETKPALVGIDLKGSDFISLQGLSLKNVSLTAKLGEKIVYTDFGEMLFTHFGISGPIVLSCSSKINRLNLNEITISIDLKPALSNEVLENRLIREFSQNNIKNICTVMRSLVPSTLIELVLNKASVSLKKNCSQITVEERKRIVDTLKCLKFSVKKLRPIEEAIVTAGGINVKEINPKTMESKLVKGLYFAGEVLDVDAFTGGFNLQIAFSTGYVAGKNC